MLQYIEFGGDAMKTIEELEIFAKDNYVPIARRDVVAFLSKLIKDNNYKSILEIGTAIGYTSISLALVSKDIRITTVEKNIEMFKEFAKDKNIYLLSTKAAKVYTDVKYEDDSYLVFGPETRGIPEDYILDNFDKAVRIPMRNNIRSLNLSNSVAIVAYEAERQLNYTGLQEKSKYFDNFLDN